jgi:hypothetical protein
MGTKDDDELTISLCKFGGPLVLFGFTPTIAWIFWKVTQKHLDAGLPLQTGTNIGLISIVLANFIFGLWMCRKGYGWFGGNKE